MKRKIRKLKCIIAPAEKRPYVAEIEDSLQKMQEIVGGCIETFLYSSDVRVVANEEARILGLKDNKRLPGVKGNVILLSSKIKGDGEFVGLSYDEIEEMMEILYV